jgi:putative endopeptidase
MVIGFVAALAVWTPSCGSAEKDRSKTAVRTETPPAAATPSAAPAAPSAPPAQDDFLRACMNEAVDAADDFFEYANGGWLGRNPIPPSESAWGVGNVVREQLYVSLRKINEEAAAASAAPGSDQRKIGDFWTTAMDVALAERLGTAPLRSELDRIGKIRSASDALDAAFALHPLGVGPLFHASVGQDEKKSDEMTVHLSQGGLGLPDRDFYFDAEEGTATIRAEYVAHLARMLRLLGRDEPAARDAAAAVMTFETSLARASRELEHLRDPHRNYNRMSPVEATSRHTPFIAWSERLAAWGLRPEFVVVGQPEFFAALNGLLTTTPVPVLQDYLALRLTSTYADSLSTALDDEHFSFYGRVLSGQKQPRPRWKRVLDAEDEAMGMVLGRIFVREYFPEPVKKRYAALVEAIREAYAARIERLDWMSPSTKEKAKAKLAAVTAKVGYPDRWKDYSALVVGRESYCANLKHAARWRFDDMISKLGKPVDRTEWEMTPQTYNAYYNPSNNEIVLPAAIFTIPGLADANADDAVVYGYAGASTIGHEITHGFDDEGRKFDAAGNLADWWTPEDAAEFERRAAAMVKQFDRYQPIPGVAINGRASLGENLADYGGVLLGLDAFKKTEQYKKGEKIGGLTPMQRFFLGYAVGWMHHEREERLRRNLLSDVHAPAKWRVLGPLANVREFHEAFGVRPGCAMWVEDADVVRVW